MKVTTIYGEMEDSLLERRDTHEDFEQCSVDAVEYWLNGEMVHRSPTINIKRGYELNLATGQIS